jgi:hypothetical protein
MKQLLIAFILFSYITATAQKVVDVSKNESLGPNNFFSVAGEPFVNAKFVRLKSGSPYFVDDWLKGRGVAESGQVYAGGTVKLNLLDNQILFINSKGEEMTSSIALKELMLTDTISGKKFQFISYSVLPASSLIKKGWYLQLATGKASLYQYFRKWMVEDKPYGSATFEQSIMTKEEFYVSVNGGVVQIKKAKDLPAILVDKKKEMENYLVQKDIQSLGTTDQFTSLINYYNSLQ